VKVPSSHQYLFLLLAPITAFAAPYSVEVLGDNPVAFYRLNEPPSRSIPLLTGTTPPSRERLSQLLESPGSRKKPIPLQNLVAARRTNHASSLRRFLIPPSRVSLSKRFSKPTPLPNKPSSNKTVAKGARSSLFLQAVVTFAVSLAASQVAAAPQPS
jgi:hypothetical protein